MPASGEFKFNRETLARLDFIGSFLSICWLVPLLFALQEGGSHYPWSSKEIIGSLVGGVVALLTFIAYETWIQRQNSTREPVFPVRFLGDPMQGLLLLYVSHGLGHFHWHLNLTKCPVYAGVFYLPVLRFTPRSFFSHNDSKLSTALAPPVLECSSSL